MRRGRSSVLFLLFSFTVFVSGIAQQAAAPVQQQVQIKIDPRLVLEAEQIWSLIAAKENPIWPGWDASATPILIYLPGVQDVLIGHPRPPEGFVPYHGPIHFGGKTIYVKNGPTIFPVDGQNTSREIGGVQTLVVADTLSNLRNNVMGFALHEHEAEAPISFEQLATDPYQQMAMVTHEAFHVYQAQRAPEKGADERALAHYPVLSPENNAGFALEAEALTEALRAKDAATVHRAALRWLAIRTARRAHLSAESIAYEDGGEFSEGLAKYTEYRLLQALEGRKPTEAMIWVQGFEGFENLSAPRERLLEAMQNAMNGALIVNNDPYGTAPVRMRLYSSGMAIAALLDRTAPEWKQKIFAPYATLTGLTAEALHASPAELDQTWKEVVASPAYLSWISKKKELQAKGTAHTLEVLRQIEAGPGTGIVIDATQLVDAKLRLGFTPFGITQIDEKRTLYGVVPIIAAWNKQTRLTEKQPMMLLVDEARKQVRFRLPASASKEELEKAFRPSGAAQQDLVVDLKEFGFKAARASAQWQGTDLLITLLPPAAQ